MPHGESHLVDLRVRADYALEIDGPVCGHIEVKAPSKGGDATASKPNSHECAQ